MSTEWWKTESGLATVRDYAMGNGLLVRASDDPTDDSCVPVAVSVLPSKFPEELFQLACAIQQDWNTLVEAISKDHDFLQSVLASVMKSDDFTRRLFEIYDQVRNDNQQTCSLGLHRSDYMVDYSVVSMETQSSTDDGGDSGRLCLRQIEINTIASSFFGLTAHMRGFHEFVHSRYCPQEQPTNLPGNSCLGSWADGVACAWDQYGKKSAYVLFVVSHGERNVFDQRPLEFELWRRHRIPVIRKTLQQLKKEATLGQDRELIVSGQEVAVVYYRAGYSPRDYTSEEEWQVRLLLERSRASNCPSAAYQLVGTKKVQQALAKPGVLERFVSDPAAAKTIRSTFAGLYSLDLTPEGDKATEMALKEPEKFVMKPQREGGGNNLYGEEVGTFLRRIGRSPERETYILMDRVHPPTQPGFILRAGTSQLQPLSLISELGILGVYVKKGDRVLVNSQGGHILRTKPATTNEGGIAVGAASLDSPDLIPAREFIRLFCTGKDSQA